MNNKGFTLTELLVAIAIMGIITGIAYPAISNLKSQNESKYYEAYKNVLVNGAKLYVDKYKKDLWSSDNDTMAYCIDKKALENNGLINENFQVKIGHVMQINIVQVKIISGKVKYIPIVVVEKENGGKTIRVYETKTLAPSTPCTAINS